MLDAKAAGVNEKMSAPCGIALKQQPEHERVISHTFAGFIFIKSHIPVFRNCNLNVTGQAEENDA